MKGETSLFATGMVAWLFWMGGCATPAARRAEGAELPPGFEFAIAGGEDDLKNRYQTVVMISSERGLCSGVLLTSRLVLTAAHCLCLPVAEGAEERHIDSSKCVASATVVTHTYQEGVGPQRPVASHPRIYQGVASPYPGFKAQIRKEGVVSFEGDLAVVRLEKPVKGMKIDFQLPKGEVTLDETLVMVGYGATQQQGEDGGRRRFGRNIVTDIQLSAGGNGAFVFRALGAHSRSGDSGGPCFRETKGGGWLVGINTGHANNGTISLFTSTFHYRTWIQERIREVEVD
jgi:hypothetical protein